MALLVVLFVAVAVVVLVMRAAAAPGSTRRSSAPRPSHPVRGQRPVTRPIAPDDDPEFLRELSRRTRRDDSAA